MSIILALAGMHRSGTSLLASWLHNSGLFLGDNLMHGKFDNPKGHFEDLEIVKIHETDLALKKLNTTGLYKIKHSRYKFENTTEKAVLNIIGKKTKYHVWGWKDPRGTLYLDEWHRLTEHFVCIAPFRDYRLVVQSLVKRFERSLKNEKNFSAISSAVKKLFFPLEIKHQKSNFINAWIKYNEGLLDFQKKHPEKCFIFNANNFNSVKNKLKSFLQKNNINIKLNDLDSIYDPQMLTKTPHIKISSDKATRIYEELNKIEQQTFKLFD